MSALRQQRTFKQSRYAQDIQLVRLELGRKLHAPRSLIVNRIGHAGACLGGLFSGNASCGVAFRTMNGPPPKSRSCANGS
jgi:hypothetical protein